MKNNIKILLIGIGGCGINIVKDINIVDKLYINTDIQSLNTIKPDGNKNYIFSVGSKGLGAGMKPEKALEYWNDNNILKKEISKIISEYDLVLTVNGLGGGTGSSITPEILKLIEQLNKKVISVSLYPFKFEGKKRKEIAEKYFEEIKKFSNMYIKISNDNILNYIKETNNIKLGFKDALKEINKIILNAVNSLLFVIKFENVAGDINIDFNDLRTILDEKGKGIIGLGTGKGPEEAFNSAINTTLLDYKDIKEINGLIISFITNENFPLCEISDFMENKIYKYINDETNLIFGTITDNKLKDEEIKLVIIVSLKEEESIKSKTNIENISKINKKIYYNSNDLDVPSYLRKKII